MLFFYTLNILNFHIVFLPWTSWLFTLFSYFENPERSHCILPWTSWVLWGPCHPVGPYRTGEGRCRHWPGSGPYWILSIGMKAREGHLRTSLDVIPVCLKRELLTFLGEHWNYNLKDIWWQFIRYMLKHVHFHFIFTRKTQIVYCYYCHICKIRHLDGFHHILMWNIL